MSYQALQPAFYEMLQPNTPWHAGAEGWTKAPWVTWGDNPNLVGLPRLGVGQEPGKPSVVPLLLAAGGIAVVLALAAGMLGASTQQRKPSHRRNRSRSKYKRNHSFTKLRSGDWGVRGSGPAPRQGERVTVTKRDGTVKTMTVQKVVWQDGSAWIAAVESEARGGGHSSAGCNRCRYIPGVRTAQIWEDCPSCGAEPIYV